MCRMQGRGGVEDLLLRMDSRFVDWSQGSPNV